jgi:hypothetical protein
MWLKFHRFDFQEQALLESLGRAIAVAQNFESNCKYVLMILEVENALERKQYSSLREARPYVEKLLQLMLGGVVHRFGKSGEFSRAEIDTLVAAKDARNYVAHEAAFELVICNGPFGPSLMDKVNRFEREVTNLTEGDGLVSLWSFYIQEHEPQPLSTISYPSDARTWVLEPLTRLGFSVPESAH